ncbi:MAG TPA: hypothetical protein VND68_10075 [Chloroflexia bacterium]|jgi:hypothetical protein|nr:hypothetical protein [Chloroflexia bacterium]
MDTFQIEVRKLADDEADRQTEETVILVNGRGLVDLLREYELPMATDDGHPDIAGGYMGLPPEDVLPPSRHFLGEPRWEVYRDGEKVSVLDCTCGTPGCWSFLAKITINEESITWSDFEQVHRREDHPNGGWSYAGLGPFTFDREQYLGALRNVEAPE